MCRSIIILILCCLYSLLSAVEPGEIIESRKYITETDFNNDTSITGSLLIAGGIKYLEDGDWAPVHHLSEIGILSDIGLDRWPLHLAIDVFSSSETGSDAFASYTADITEIHVGPRFVMDIPYSLVTLYSGGGLVYAQMEISGTTGVISFQDEITTLGGYLNFGSYLKFKKRWLVGFDLRYTEIRGDLGPAHNVNGGGWNALLTAGIRF
ncbi:MAG: hypothetical protein HRU15_00995 [Planctomycetes bacterium]|nr:hypothetical protein [Planctomycetota bacterium]